MSATFAFAGRTLEGARVSGERRAASAADAVAALRRERVLVTTIGPARRSAPAAGWIRRRKAVSARSLAVFTRQFAVMIGAGLPLVQCLEMLGEQEEDREFAATIRAVRAEVEDGSTLADALRAHPRSFDRLYVGMVATAEAGGVLDTILDRLAVQIEKHVALRGQVRSAMMYPVAVRAIAAVVVGVILWKVIPTFAALFEGLGAVLPLPTRLVIAASDSLATFVPLLGFGAAGAALAFRRYYSTAGGRLAVDRVVMRLPAIGGIVRRNAVARFCRTLSALVGAGVPILESLEITAVTAGNAAVEEAVLATRAAVERGESLAAPLRDTEVFPALVAQMINVGETTGALDTMLGKVADFYEEEVDRAVAGMTALLEPVTVAVLGIVVGGIVVAMYLPVFDLIGRLAG
ncbi:MAG: type II secretion system F family protein [Acidobacteria bacterium]|nr:type II secretion system F family protein [Acidobacteriota bacterium]